MKKVRCKFYVAGVSHHHVYSPPGQPQKSCAEVRLLPIWEQDGPNRAWSEATPSGEIKMTITNPAAVDVFELGRVYTVDFAPADESDGA